MSHISRREFLTRMGVTVGSVALTTGDILGSAYGAEPPKGKVPDTPFRIGHMAFLSGPARVYGEPSYKGHLLAAEEINSLGGLLGKRKIETIKADEAAGPEANGKEMRRLRQVDRIAMFTGIGSSANTPVLGPIAEELKILTLFTDGCTDFLFEKIVPNPHYTFRISNPQSADGVTCAIAVAQTWPDMRRIAHIHPDYQYGRNAFDHFGVAIRKLLPNTQNVAEEWPKLFTGNFTSHIATILSRKPDLLVTSLWGGDYAAFYKQALTQDLFKKMRVANTLGFGSMPNVIGKDHPEGVLAGVHSNYFFTHPRSNQWPANGSFVQRYYDRWKEYPSCLSEGAYVALQMLKVAVERANKVTGGWPSDEVIVSQLEGLSVAGPAGYVYIRPDNHQAYKDAIAGFSMNTAEYPFPILDPNRIITFPIRNITAPPGWKGEPTAAHAWIEQTWPKMY